MTRRYSEKHYDLETRDFKVEAEWSFTTYPGDNKTFTVCRNGIVKSINVVDDPEYSYKLTKNKVIAKDGAAGVFKFVDDALYNGFMECLAWKILNHCFKYGVEAA